jgi:UDP-N-acetylglucosamine enolpyruvyl transferase
MSLPHLRPTPLPKSANLNGLLAIIQKTDIELAGGSEAAKTAIDQHIKLFKTCAEVEAYTKEVMQRVQGGKACKPVN